MAARAPGRHPKRSRAHAAQIVAILDGKAETNPGPYEIVLRAAGDRYAPNCPKAELSGVAYRYSSRALLLLVMPTSKPAPTVQTACDFDPLNVPKPATVTLLANSP